MRTLVTGSCGFVGQYLCDALADEGHEVYGFGVHGCHSDRTKYVFADIRKKDEIDRAIAEARPDEVYHLAAQSNVPESWRSTAETFEINVGGTINMLTALAKHSPSAKLLVVGTAAEYGDIRPEDCPVKETHPLAPNNPYAVSKMTQNAIACQLGARAGLTVVCTRSFNHTGPGQQDAFVCSSLAKQFAAAEKDKSIKTLEVGNLEPVRDFSDVRDVVRAYTMLLRNGAPGETYNVCSGKGYSIRDIIDILEKLSTAKLEIRTDAERERKVENWHVVGDCSKLKKATGWAATYKFEQTIGDLLARWRKDLGK